MKKRTIVSSALVVAAAGLALIPNYSYAASGKRDYSKQSIVTGSDEAKNFKVRATSDGGYVIAGVTVADGCTSNVGEEYKTISELGGNSKLSVCGYVEKYSVNGEEEWSAEFTAADYSSSQKTYTEDNTEKTLDFAYMVKPLELMETTTGIGMLTEGGDYFLLNPTNGEASKSFSLIQEILSPTNVTVPYRMYINSNGSVSYGNYDKDSVNHSTSDGATNSDLTQLNFAPMSIAKQYDNYVMESDSGLYSCDENLRCALIEGVASGTFVSTIENTDGPLGALSVTDIGNNKTKYETYFIVDGKVIAKKSETYKTSNNTSTPVEESDYTYSVGDGSATTLTSIDGFAEAYSDSKTNKKTQNVAVTSYDSKLNYLGEMKVATDSGNDYASMAFLKDGSLVVVGTNGGAPIYERYVNMVLTSKPTDSTKKTSKTSKVKNPNTLDNIAVFGAGLAVTLGAGFVLLKRLMRR